ncbi:MAG: ABC transporter substrate-binding protein [Candidatus Riflebacteria bacterium]|nr:ABC transporter substrate-binding protein [Candidatus Riflebacteria bacterium]
MKKSSILGMLLGSLLWSGVMIPVCAKPVTLEIGVNAELTGSIPVVGNSCVNAAKMATDEINASGGMKIGEDQVTFKLSIEDNEDKPESAAAMTQKFIGAKAIAMIGPNASRNAIPATVIAENAKFLMITPWSTNIKATQDKNWIFRACFTDDFQGVVMANFAAGNLKLKKVAVLFDVGSEYNKGIAEIFQKSFKELGGEITAFETYSSGDKDFTAQLTKIAGSGAEGLFLPNYYSEVPLQVQQARDLGFEGQIFGSDSWGSAELLKLGGKSMEGLYFSTHYAPDMATDLAKKFIEAYTAKNGGKPDDVAALTYDSFGLLFKAISTANSIEPDKIRQALSTLAEFPGITGKMKFNAGSGSPVKSAVILQIKDGAFKYHDMVGPKN